MVAKKAATEENIFISLTNTCCKHLQLNQMKETHCKIAQKQKYFKVIYKRRAWLAHAHCSM